MYYDCDKEGEWSNSGGHAKNNTYDKHDYRKKYWKTVFDWLFSDKLDIWDIEDEGDKRKRNIIMNHGEFTVECVAEWCDDKGDEKCAKD